MADLLFPPSPQFQVKVFVCTQKKALIIIIVIKVLFDHLQKFCWIMIMIVFFIIILHSLNSFHSHSTKQSLNHKEEDCLFGSFLFSFKGILVCQDHAVVVVVVV